MILRSAEEQDRLRVSELLVSCGLVPLDDTAQFGPQYVLAVLPNDVLAGVAGIECYEHHALLRSVAVETSFRGQGYGQRLAEDRLSWAVRNAISTVFLLTADAGPYWRRFGFEEMSREVAPTAIRNSHEWATACPANAQAMRLLL